MARPSQQLGQLFLELGNYEGARVHFEEHLEIDKSLHFWQGLAVALENLGHLHRHQGDYDRAAHYYEKGLMMSREHDDKGGLSNSMWYLGLLALHRNDYQLARQQFIDYYNLVCAMYREEISVCDLLSGLAAVAAGMRQPECAARLYGAAQALFESTEYRIPPFDQAEFDRHIQIAREQLGGAAFEALVTTGRAMTLEQAIDLALSL
jgi:tetratricopeptide (TPR) repeat protein